MLLRIMQSRSVCTLPFCERHCTPSLPKTPFFALAGRTVVGRLRRMEKAVTVTRYSNRIAP